MHCLVFSLARSIVQVGGLQNFSISFAQAESAGFFSSHLHIAAMIESSRLRISKMASKSGLEERAFGILYFLQAVAKLALREIV